MPAVASLCSAAAPDSAEWLTLTRVYLRGSAPSFRPARLVNSRTHAAIIYIVKLKIMSSPVSDCSRVVDIVTDHDYQGGSALGRLSEPRAARLVNSRTHDNNLSPFKILT